MRPAVRAQRARRDQGRDRVARRHRAGRQGDRLRRLHARLHRAAQGGQRRVRAARRGLRRGGQARPLRRRRTRAAARRARRGRAGRRDQGVGPDVGADPAAPGAGRPGASVRVRRGRACRAAPRGDGGAAARGSRRSRGLPAAAADLDGVRRGDVRVPRRWGRPARPRRERGVGGAVSRRVGGPPGLRRGPGARPRVCRRAGDLRGVRCPARRPVRRHGRVRHDR